MNEMHPRRKRSHNSLRNAARPNLSARVEIRFMPKSSHRGRFLQLGVNGFLVAMLVNTQLRMDICLLEAAIGNPCVRAFDSAFDQRVGL